MTARRRWRWGWLLAVVALVAGCAAPPDRSLPPPDPTSSTTPESTTSEPDYSQIALTPVDGATTTLPPISEGRSTIRGTVTGPDGPLPDAVVRLERLVGDAVQRKDVRTGPDGRYEATNVPGGRYRVRAFQSPVLTSQQTEIFFLIDGDERELALPTVPFSGIVARSSTTPGAPIINSGVNLAVRVAQRIVDADGVGREEPVGNIPVRVNQSGWTALDDDTSGLTGPDGVVVFSFRCDQVGPVSATAVVGVEQEVFPLTVPPCAPKPTTTTTTSTTAPPGGGGSTSTTASTTTTAAG